MPSPTTSQFGAAANDSSLSQQLLADPRWATGSVRPRASAELFAWWFGLTVVSALLLPLVLYLEQAKARISWGADATVIGLAALSLHLLVGAARTTLAWRRYGSLELVLDPFPGSLGGHAGGSLELPLVDIERPATRVTVSCVRVQIRRRSNGNRSRSESVVWSREQFPTLTPTPAGTSLAFTFDVPEHVPQTEPSSGDYHTWSVRVEARVPGHDLDRVFEVPILRTEKPLHAQRPVPFGEVLEAGELPPESGVRVSPLAQGVRLDFPMLRALSLGLTCTIFGLVFGAIGIGVGQSGASRGAGDSGLLDLFASGITGTIVVVFCAFGALFTALGLWTLFNSLEAHVDRHELRLQRRFLGLKRATRVEVADIERITLEIASQSGQGPRAELGYRIRAHLNGGAKAALGDGIRGTSAAERLAEIITQASGVPVELVARRSRARRARSVRADAA